ncbi:hypothetical protein CPJCM30710_27550 [Clostridium polyendosporum]|uniref:Lipoprotein n=1 Tax=Clostridium polyendosporum TaxID=69208 RepID=A0A919VFB0_9CLOT|nr:hypothetical protein [Clostridium polyendosporum]GIM30089.1 hypothetical protein CPJCM30710_27550 [Clostridium polyendosporum]
MIKFKRIAVVISVCMLLSSIFTACSSKNNSSKDQSGSSASSSSLDNKKSEVLEAYKKVNLGMTKEEVDSTLDLEPKAETGKYAIKGTVNYEDMDTGYGVSVIYNDKNMVFAKTAIYSSNSEIASLCKEPVKEEQVDKIKKDMDYKDVINILGGEGVECNITGKETDLSVIGVIRRWANKDGSGIQIVFSKDDKVGNVIYFNHD